jgi:hypothetical protein
VKKDEERAIELMRDIPLNAKQLVRHAETLKTQADKLSQMSFNLLDDVTALAQLIRTAAAYMEGENNWDELGQADE